jgi:hypothetical protein
MHTLREWQQLCKDRDDLIINASDTSGSDSLQPFPIGMYYRYLDYEESASHIGDHENLVWCGFHDHTDFNRRPLFFNRKTIVRTLRSNGIPNKMKTYHEYYSGLSNYKFVVSPEGNGIDCHRHYEALIAGCIPIVEYNVDIVRLYKGCPILYTRNYKEITPAFLEQTYLEMIDTPYDFSRLFISSYPPEVQRQIKMNGNHWTTVKLKKIKWDIK